MTESVYVRKKMYLCDDFTEKLKPNKSQTKAKE